MRDLGWIKTMKGNAGERLREGMKVEAGDKRHERWRGEKR